MLVRIANRQDPDETASSEAVCFFRSSLLLQKQSDLGLHCLSRPFWQAISVQIIRTSTI